MGIGRALSFTERLLIILVTFAIVIYMLVETKIWSADLVGYFFRVGKWPELVFVFLVAMAVSMALEKLLRWEIRAQSKQERGRRR